MAIIKQKTRKKLMQYQQYKTTALKHLQTCEYMIANLSSERLNKLKVLRNVYYLCGYTFEGLINFWIFELLKRDGHEFKKIYYDRTVHRRVTEESVKYLDFSLGSGKRIFYSKYKVRDEGSEYWLEQHKFQRNLDVFQYLADGDMLSIVPLIGDKSNEPYPKMLSLFDSWDVKVRYQNHPTVFPYQQQSLSPESLFQTTFETDISNFVKTARLVYDVLEDIQFGRTPRI
jgi:hypothetical protein